MFGEKDSPTCANYAIKQTARDNSCSLDGLTVETALRALYLDYLLKSVSTVDMSILLSKELIVLLNLQGMRLTNFISNNKEVLESPPESERSTIGDALHQYW